MRPEPSSLNRQAIKIRVMGMDDRACKILDMAFNGPGKQRYQLVNGDEAQVTIIDIDGVGAQKILKQCQQQYHDRPVIVISVRERNLTDVGWIKKPVKMALLFRLLDDLHIDIELKEAVKKEKSKEQLSAKVVVFPEKTRPASNKSQPVTNPIKQETAHTPDFEDMPEDVSQMFCGKAQNVDLSDLEQRKSIYYAPDHYFQGILKKAIDVANATDKAIRIEGIRKSIVVLPDKQGLLTLVDDCFLRALCYSPAIQSAVSFAPVTIDPEQARSRDDFVRLDNFIWKSCLLSSKGRIPVGINVSAPVQIIYWPNFTRLDITPHAMRIISLWADEPRSLVTTARMLGIEQRYVFALFSAAYEMGYIDVKFNATDMQPVISENRRLKSHKRHGLLRRILHHLGAVR